MSASDGNPRTKKNTRFQIPLALLCGLLPYLGGLLAILTQSVGWLAFAGALICFISTTGAYLLRKQTDPSDAKQRLLIDPMLYAFEFFFTVVIIRYTFMR